MVVMEGQGCPTSPVPAARPTGQCALDFMGCGWESEAVLWHLLPWAERGRMKADLGAGSLQSRDWPCAARLPWGAVGSRTV